MLWQRNALDTLNTIIKDAATLFGVIMDVRHRFIPGGHRRVKRTVRINSEQAIIRMLPLILSMLCMLLI